MHHLSCTWNHTVKFITFVVSYKYNQQTSKIMFKKELELDLRLLFGLQGFRALGFRT